MSGKKRIAFLDSARAICMLYIVGFWHMQEYTTKGFYNPLTHALTRGMLATFVFISAYLVGKRSISGWADVWKFCKSRLLRLYPLFFLASTSLYLIHVFWNVDYIISTSQYIKTIMGIAFILTPAPSTMWFINMIFIFDGIGLIVNALKKILWKLVACGLIIAGVFLAEHYFGRIDDRILIYCPIYCLGLLVSVWVNLSERINYYALAGWAVLFGVLYGVAERYLFLNILAATACVGVVFELGKLCNRVKWLERLLGVVSYGSMCAYLFHRQILCAVTRYSGPLAHWQALFLMLPLVIVLACGIQKLYNKFVDLVINNLSRKGA